MYISGCLSMSTGDNFNQSAYPSLELGACFKNFCFGFNSGRLNIDKSPFNGEKIENYYYELKSSVSFPLGAFKGYVVAGWGQYYNSTHSFIEYGGGVVYSIKKIDLMIQVSNWDRTVYVSPCIAYNFSL